MTAPPRKPAAFRLPQPAQREEPSAAPEAIERPRRPRAASPAEAIVTPAAVDVFDEPDLVDAPPPAAVAPRRTSWLGRLFFGAVGILVSLALGLWTDRLIRDLFSRADWLGWLAVACAAIALLALVVVIARELLALARLSSVEHLRARAAEAIASDDPKAGRRVVDDLIALFSTQPETAVGRRAMADLSGEIIDGAALVGLAETEILAPIDARAKILVLDAAKRVSLVTAVSPRAVVDIAYVVFEAGRLIRRLSELYAGRPGTLGFLRLTRSVLAHLAVTGSMAAGDSIVQQIVGHGLAARLSAKLGEGVVNGMMTARIGMAAMEAVRPLPFSATRRPSLGEFMSALASFASRKPSGES